MIYRNTIDLKRTITFNLQRIEFTYKKLAITFRSGIKNVCCIDDGSKKRCEISAGTSGWRQDEVRNFVRDLPAAGVKKRFIGYHLKNADS